MSGSSNPGTNTDAVNGVNIGTSCYGKPVPIVYGTARVAPNHIWMPRELWVRHAGSSGGKGGGSAGGQDTYGQGAISAICEGPIVSIGRVWRDKDLINTLAECEPQAPISLFLGARSQAPWSFLTTVHPQDFTIRFEVPTGTPGSLYTYTLEDPLFTSVVSVSYSIPRAGGPMREVAYPPPAADTYSRAANVFTFKQQTGIAGAYSVILKYRFSGNFAPYAIGYGGTALVASSEWNLGSSNSMKNYSYEVRGFFSDNVDASPADVIYDFLTNTVYGCAFPLMDVNVETGIDGRVESSYRRYCDQSNFRISPVFSEQKPALDHVKDVLRATNADVVTVGGKVTIVPLGDVAVGTYEPANTIQYALTDDDFVPGAPGQDPVAVERKSQADTFNSVPVEYLRRGTDKPDSAYMVSLAEEKVESDAALTGLRKDSAVKLHCITDETHARHISSLMALRSVYIRNRYSFKLDIRYSLLDPLDLVTLTNAHLGLVALPVRIRTIDEDDEGTLSVTAEEWPFGVAGAVAFTNQSGDGGGQDTYVDPLDAERPTIFAPPLVRGQQPELWIGSTGMSKDWAGAQVWISWDDGSHFELAGEIGRATFGTVEVGCPAGPPIDNTNVLDVHLGASGTTLASVTQVERDAGMTMCLVGGEVLSYQTANVQGADVYRIGLLLRGQKGTNPAAHAVGERFLRIDSAVARIPIDERRFGTQVVVKLVSFNMGRKFVQDSALVNEWAYTLPALAKALRTEPAPFVETFDRFDVRGWDLNTAAASGVLTTVDGAGVDGGAVLQATGRVCLYARVNVPIAPSKTYRITVRYRQTSDDAGTNQIAFGLVGIAANGETLVNLNGGSTLTPFHMVLANPTVAGGWVEATFYMKGSAATGTNPGTYSAPGVWHSNTRYARALLWLNDGGSTGVQQVDTITFAEADPVAVTAIDTANNAQGDATDAMAIAGGRNRVFFQDSAPSSPVGGYALVDGDLWYNTNTTTNCPDNACKGHTLAGTPPEPLTGSAQPHRRKHWPHRWNGAAWVDAQEAQQIVASDIVAGVVSADMLQANAIKTSNYAFTGSEGTSSEVATAGAKMQNTTGLSGAALLTCKSGLKVGTRTLEQMFTVMAHENARPVTVFNGTVGTAIIETSYGPAGTGVKRIAAVGTNVAATSDSHGVVWVTRTIPTGTWKALASNTSSASPMLVAVGTNVAASSTDGGLTWTSRTIPTGDWGSVVWDGTYFVALNAAASATTLVRSTDGINWGSTISHGQARTEGWGAMGFSASQGRIMAVSLTTFTFELQTFHVLGVMSSTDHGSTWSAQTLKTDEVEYGYSAPAWSEELGQWFVSARRGQSYTSTNGTTWTSHTTGGGLSGPLVWTGSHYLGYYYATGSAGPLLVISFDGVSWYGAEMTWLGYINGIVHLTADYARRVVFIGGGGPDASSPNAGVGLYFQP